MRLVLLAFAMLMGMGAANHERLDAHPKLSVVRPPAARPAWMYQPASENLPEPDTRRARLVIAYCGQCHSPPPPAMRTAAEWRWMIVQMDTKAPARQRPNLRTVRNDELMDIADYYGIHARPSPGP